jgi:hypothetical protein
MHFGVNKSANFGLENPPVNTYCTGTYCSSVLIMLVGCTATAPNLITGIKLSPRKKAGSKNTEAIPLDHREGVFGKNIVFPWQIADEKSEDIDCVRQEEK